MFFSIFATRLLCQVAIQFIRFFNINVWGVSHKYIFLYEAFVKVLIVFSARVAIANNVVCNGAQLCVMTMNAGTGTLSLVLREVDFRRSAKDSRIATLGGQYRTMWSVIVNFICVSYNFFLVEGRTFVIRMTNTNSRILFVNVFHDGTMNSRITTIVRVITIRSANMFSYIPTK